MSTGAEATRANPRAHLDAALKAEWKQYRKRLRNCRRQCSEEAVHDLRVELRRLLSHVELAAPFVSARREEKSRRLFKKHLDLFGELRDAQVQLVLTRPLARRFPTARLYRSELDEAEKEALRKVGRAIRRFKPARLKKAIERVRKEINWAGHRESGEQDWVTIGDSLRKAFGVVSNLLAAMQTEQPATIHRVRVAFKKYRYMIEALAPILCSVSEADLKAMHDHQALMGTIQDLEVGLGRFEGFAGETPASPRSVSALREELRRRHQTAIGRYARQAQKLFEFAPARFMSLESVAPHATAGPT